MRRIILLGLILFVGCGPKPLPHENKSVDQLRAMLDSDDPQKQAQGALGLSLKGAEAAPAVPRGCCRSAR